METNNTNTQQTNNNSNPKPKKDWRALEVGCIWQFAEDRMTLKMKNKDGKEIRFVCFKNKFKDPNNREDDRLPAWRVYKDDSEYNPTASTQKKVESKPKPAAKKVEAPAPEENNEEFV